MTCPGANLRLLNGELVQQKLHLTFKNLGVFNNQINSVKTKNNLFG